MKLFWPPMSASIICETHTDLDSGLLFLVHGHQKMPECGMKLMPTICQIQTKVASNESILLPCSTRLMQVWAHVSRKP